MLVLSVGVAGDPLAQHCVLVFRQAQIDTDTISLGVVSSLFAIAWTPGEFTMSPSRLEALETTNLRMHNAYMEMLTDLAWVFLLR